MKQNKLELYLDKVKWEGADHPPKDQLQPTPLIIKTQNSNIEIGYYNVHDTNQNLTGYYKTPNFDQRIDIDAYTIAHDKLIFKCDHCGESSIRGSLWAIYDRNQNRSYPCCPKCENCHFFTLVGINEEE